MALNVASLVEVTLRQNFMGQQIANVWGYGFSVYVTPVTAVGIAEAWWNHVKGSYRAFMPSSYGTVFRSVLLREMNNVNGEYAEFDIPTAEQTGTRSGSGENMPPFIAAAVRLVVGTRTTRPGQKRLAGIQEGFQNAGVLDGATITLAKAVADAASGTIVLGAPALGTTMFGQVFRKDPLGYVIANQAITGTIVNPNVSSQNSRKFNRGQ